MLADLARQLQCHPGLYHAFPKTTEPIAHVAQPIMRAGQRAGVAKRARHRHRLLENGDVVAQRQRIEYARHSKLVGQQAPLQGLLPRAIGNAIQRLHRDLILHACTVQRERGHGLVAGAFGIASRSFQMASALRVICQGFECVVAIGILRSCQQRSFDALVQRLALSQANCIVYRVPRDAVLEAKSGGRRIGIQKIRIGQRAYRHRIRCAAAGRNQQSVRHRVSDHRRGPHHADLGRRQA